MGIDLWNHQKFIHHKVRNMMRRGWHLKTYNDKKMLRGRVKTGEKIENDGLDILHSVGYVAHVKPDKKSEVITMDVGGDTSRRVIAWVLGDREYHPQPDENEAYIYAPGDKKIYQRFKKKKEDGDQGGGGDGQGQQQGQTIDRGHEPGAHTDAKDQRVTSKTESSQANQADKGIGNATKDGNYTIDAGKNTQFKAGKHVRQGETVRDGQMFVNGNVHASDHIAGGGASVSPRSAVSRAMPFNSQSDEPERPKEDGTQEWSASGIAGNTSLLNTAAKVGTMGGMMGNLSGMMGMISQMMQGGGGSPQQQQQLEQMVQQLQDQLNQLNQMPS